MSKILKKSTAGDLFITDLGMTVPGEGEILIDPSQYINLRRSENVISYLSDGSITYSDGNENLSLSDAIDHIREYYQHSPIDPDTMMPSVSTRKLPATWYPEFREIEFTTATLNSIHDRDTSNSDIGHHTALFYDVNGDELVSPSQATLDSDCHKTVIRFNPNRSWAIRGASTRQIAIPSQPLYVWTDFKILVAQNTWFTNPYANGGLNMEFQSVREDVGDSGDNYSFFKAGDMIDWTFEHGVGVNHRIRIIYQLAFEVGG